jgi:hypothetical protein
MKVSYKIKKRGQIIEVKLPKDVEDFPQALSSVLENYGFEHVNTTETNVWVWRDETGGGIHSIDDEAMFLSPFSFGVRTFRSPRGKLRYRVMVGEATGAEATEDFATALEQALKNWRKEGRCHGDGVMLKDALDMVIAKLD